MDRLFAITGPVLGLRCGKSVADTMVRQQILDLLRLSNGVRVYVPRGKRALTEDSAREDVRVTGEHDQAKRLPAARPSDREVLWLDGADELTKKEMLNVLTAALESGRRCMLVFGRRPVP